MLTADNTWAEISDTRPTIAVFPIGATEQHGINLPLSTDTLIAEQLARAVAQGLDAYLLPTQPFGMSDTHLSFPGTVSLSRATLTALIDDVLRSLALTGFTQVVLISWHGGNYPILPAETPALQEKHPDLQLVTVMAGRATASDAARAITTTDEWHAGEREASLVAYFRPELVGPAPTDCPGFRARLASVRRTPETGFPLDVREVSASGSLGEPSCGSAAKGEALWRATIPALLADLRAELGLE